MGKLPSSLDLIELWLDYFASSCKSFPSSALCVWSYINSCKYYSPNKKKPRFSFKFHNHWTMNTDFYGIVYQALSSSLWSGKLFKLQRALVTWNKAYLEQATNPMCLFILYFYSSCTRFDVHGDLQASLIDTSEFYLFARPTGGVHVAQTNVLSKILSHTEHFVKGKMHQTQILNFIKSITFF